MARRIPRFDGGIIISWDGEEGVFNDSGEAGLIECEDVNVMALVFLDDALGVVFGVERVHQDEGDIAAVGAIQVLITLGTKIVLREVPQFDGRSSREMCFPLGPR